MTKAEEKRINKMTMLRKRLMRLISKADQDEANQLVSDLLAAQAMADIEAVELVVPSKSVVERVNVGPTELMRTTHGILYQAKGGFSTFIDSRFESLYNMFSLFIDGYKSDFKVEGEDEDARITRKSFADAWMQLMIAPMYYALDPGFAVEQAIALTKFFNRITEEMLAAESKPETADDVMANRAVINFEKAINTLNSELPQQ